MVSTNMARSFCMWVVAAMDRTLEAKNIYNQGVALSGGYAGIAKPHDHHTRLDASAIKKAKTRWPEKKENLERIFHLEVSELCEGANFWPSAATRGLGKLALVDGRTPIA